MSQSKEAMQAEIEAGMTATLRAAYLDGTLEQTGNEALCPTCEEPMWFEEHGVGIHAGKEPAIVKFACEECGYSGEMKAKP